MLQAPLSHFRYHLIKTCVNSIRVKDGSSIEPIGTLRFPQVRSHKLSVHRTRSILPLLTKAIGGPMGPYHPHAKEQSPTDSIIGCIPVVHLRRLGNRDHHLITGSHGYACVHGVACATGPRCCKGASNYVIVTWLRCLVTKQKAQLLILACERFSIVSCFRGVS